MEEVTCKMEKADHDSLIELLIDRDAQMYSGEKSCDLVETILDMVRDGIRGYVDEPDEALLAEASSDYVDEHGNLVGDPVGGDWDPTEDEVFRIFAKYRFPDLLCKVCGGSGEVKPEGSIALVDCDGCRGSGLSGLVLPPKYVVVCKRQIVKRVELRAATPREAAEEAKKLCAWTSQSDEQLTLEVFAEPHFDTDEPLYQE